MVFFLWQTSEASSVFDHLISKGVKPNSTTYSLETKKQLSLLSMRWELCSSRVFRELALVST
ncbi:hypothetical protein ACSBR1_034508 [Camellia fascicularis]